MQQLAYAALLVVLQFAWPPGCQQCLQTSQLQIAAHAFRDHLQVVPRDTYARHVPDTDVEQLFQLWVIPCCTQ